MREITLTRGKVALVDDADYPWLNQWKWCALKVRNTFYAVRNSPTRNGKRTTILMHREILNPSSAMQTDHKDGNGLNCQRSNLRAATTAENSHNQRKHKGTTSKYKGVSWDRIAGKWLARIRVGEKQLHLGYFLSEIEAARAYDCAALRYFGEFARTNNYIQKAG